MAVTGYNLKHLQAATNDGSPTYEDINYATTFEPTITQENDEFRADAQVVITAQGAPTGGGSLGYVPRGSITCPNAVTCLRRRAR